MCLCMQKMKYDKDKDILICYDAETTGRSYKDDRIVQFAASVVYKGNLLFEFCSYVCPESGGLRQPRRMSLGASRVTGIDDKLLLHKPSFSVMWNRFVKEFRTHTDAEQYGAIVFLGYNNHAFDDRLLWLELRRSGRVLANDLNSIDAQILSLDTFKEVKRIYKPKTKNKRTRILLNNKLSTVYEHITNKPLVSAHDALTDVHATIVVFNHVIEIQDDVFTRKFSDVNDLVPPPQKVSVKFNKARLCKSNFTFHGISNAKGTAHEKKCALCKIIFSTHFLHICSKSVA